MGNPNSLRWNFVDDNKILSHFGFYKLLLSETIGNGQNATSHKQKTQSPHFQCILSKNGKMC